MREPQPEHQAVTGAGRRALEVLRLAAIGALVLYHACLLQPEGAAGPAQRLVSRFGSAGWIGTALLLALSGFLAVGARARAGGAASFLLRRAAQRTDHPLLATIREFEPD